MEGWNGNKDRGIPFTGKEGLKLRVRAREFQALIERITGMQYHSPNSKSMLFSNKWSDQFGWK